MAFIPVHTVSSLPKALQMALISNPINDSGRKHSSLVLCDGPASKAESHSHSQEVTALKSWWSWEAAPLDGNLAQLLTSPVALGLAPIYTNGW